MSKWMKVWTFVHFLVRGSNLNFMSGLWNIKIDLLLSDETQFISSIVICIIEIEQFCVWQFVHYFNFSLHISSVLSFKTKHKFSCIVDIFIFFSMPAFHHPTKFAPEKKDKSSPGLNMCRNCLFSILALMPQKLKWENLSGKFKQTKLFIFIFLF